MKNVQDIYRLSPMQREMLLYSLYAPTEGANVEQVYWTWRGPLDHVAFQRAWQQVVERHPILRTAYFWEGMAEPVQAVRATVEVQVERLDWQGLSTAEQKRRLEQYLEEVRRAGIHLSQAPLMRLGVMQVAPEVYRCAWSYHHVLLDGWSAPVCLREVLLLYQAYSRGQEIQLETPRPYRDYIQWLGRQNLAEARRYWQETLRGFGTATPLFIDGPAAAAGVGERRYQQRELRLTASASAEVQATVRQHRLTLNTLIQGAWALVLSRYSGEDDVVFGATVSGRPPSLPGVDTMVGLFINTLPVRAVVQAETEVGAFLQALQAEQIAARRYDYLPLLEIRRLGEVATGQLLFESVIVVENLPDRHIAQRLETGAEICEVGRTEARTGFPLTLMVLPGTELLIQCIYDEARFHGTAIERVLAALGQLLEHLLDDPSRRLREVSVLTEEERRALIDLGHAPALAGEPAICIHDRIAALAEKTPDALAVIQEQGHGQGMRRMTYRELDARATHLARRLRALGVNLGSRVGLCLERSPEVLVAMLGTLKAGGAYVPLDPASPKERQAALLGQAGVQVLLSQTCLGGSLPETSIPVLFLDGDGPDDASNAPDPADPPLAAVPPEAAAYVIYTSGSTGAPKGVVVEHRGLVGIAAALARQFALGPADRVLQFTSLAWDTCCEEIYPCLLSGACLVLRTEAMLDPHVLLESCRESGVTVADLPTAYWHELIELLDKDGGDRGDGRAGGGDSGGPAGTLRWPPGVRLLIIGGEAANPEKLGRWFSKVGAGPRLINTFGPTETTIVATCAELIGPPAPGRPVPIGRPLSGVVTHVLNRTGQLAPLGVPGELFIGGIGVTRGYLDQPGATAERFLPLGWSGEPGARWYRTGDRVRYRHDGQLEFLGRSDRQVKIRGVRIEPGEIERVLAQHPGVKDVVVLAREEAGGHKQLVAYVVPRGESPVQPAELRTFAGQKLPEPMVPASFVMLEALPWTSRGKLDLAALPAPQAPAVDERAYTPPSGPTEEMLARIWSDVLKRERVGAHDSFFDLGGNSLMAMQVVSRVRRDSGMELPLRALFGSPTVAAVAAELDRARESQTPATPPLVPVPRSGTLPLSFAQQRLWFLDQFEPGNPFYNIATAVRLTGVLDDVALARSLRGVVRRHEALRTRFEVQDGEPVQIIDPAGDTDLELARVDLEILPAEEREARARDLAAEEALRPFDLARGPLVRATLLRLGPDDHVLLFTVHHIVADGWSMAVLVREVGAMYGAFAQGQTSSLGPLGELPLQYVDYAAWQRKWLAGEMLERQRAYWQKQLAGPLPVLELPRERARPPVQTYRGTQHVFLIGSELSGALEALSRRHEVTLFMTLLAAFQTLLHRYTGQKDIIVGTPVAGRTHAELEGLIGFFVNTLALRTDLAGNPTFRELLGRVREVTLGAYAHQDLPFEKLVEALAIERDLSRSPVFQVAFAFQNVPVAAIELPGLRLSWFEFDPGIAKFDLTLFVQETAQGLRGALEYNSDLFEAQAIERLAGHFVKLLGGIVARPEAEVSLAALPLLGEPERHTLLRTWAGDRVEYPRESSVSALFEAQARRAPDAVALVFGERVLTYGELDRRANQLAHRLRELGVRPETPVGLCLERSPELVVGVLGILKAGGFYVPLEVSYPAARIEAMLEDVAARVLVTERKFLPALAERFAVSVCMDAPDAGLGAQPETPLVPGTHGDHTAYVMFTSGSTGRPKGVQVPHRGIVRLVMGSRFMRFGAGEVGLLFAPVAFDASTLELWGALLHGARLVVAPPEALSLEALGTLLVKARVTTLWLTSALFEQMVLHQAEALGSVSQVLAGGDVLPAARVQELLDRGGVGQVVNGYGPTENTTFTACHALVPGARVGNSVPIGRPIANTRVYVVDGHFEPVPVGVAGELLAGGEGLAHGYVRRPELTAERFVPDPFSGEPGARLYRTGDLVRWRTDGTLEYLGRADAQVKLRGFRIELGEIEVVLGQHPGVRQVAVVAREDGPLGKRLVAYVVAEEGAGVEMGEALRAFLQERLPEYMVPAAFVFLPALPLSPNGKVDRKALPAPEMETGADAAVGEAPRTETEARLAQLWGEVLHRSGVGIHDDFFALGGHSLLATQLVARIHKTWQVELPLRTLFGDPTVAAVAAEIDRLRGEGNAPAPPLVPVPRSGTLPLSFAQQRLWFLDQLTPGRSLYNIVVGMRVHGPIDDGAFGRSLQALGRRHETLRTTFGASDGEPYQRIAALEETALPCEVVDLRSLPGPEREEEARRLVREEAERPFDLEKGPLLRSLLLRLSDRESALVLNMHHIVSDGWSMGVLVRELVALYEPLSQGRPVELPPLPVQYVDYAVWQRQWLEGERLERQLGYWKQKLSGVAPLELPTDFPRPRLPSYRGATIPVAYPRALQEGLVRLGHEEGATLFMVLLGAFQVLLARYARQGDVAVGTPIAGRTRTEVEGLIGFFVNTLVLRTDLSGDPSFRELLGRVRDVTLEAYAHQDVPFEKVVEELSPARQLDRSPLFQVMLALQNTPEPEIRQEEVTLVPLEVDSGTAKFDLTLSLWQTPEGLRGTLGYSTDLYSEETVRRMVEHLGVLLEGIIAAPARRVGDLPLLTDAERQLLLSTWNDTGPGSTEELGVHDLVAAQVARTPEAIALVVGTRRVSYRELEEQAHALAWRLRELGVGPETRVAVCLERSAELVMALLGILKAGGAYVPLDPAYPIERLRFMLEDAAAEVVITQRKLQALLAGAKGTHTRPQVLIEELGAAPMRSEPLPPWQGRGHLAYVLYTSGSTGRPKGVAIEHRSAVTFVRWAHQAFSPEQLRGVLAATSVCFDLSVFELFVPLSSGGTVILADNALALPELPARDQVTLVNTVPSAIAELVRLGGVPTSVRTVNLAGEALPGTLVENLYGLGFVQEVCNLYGPTEDTTYSTWTPVPRQLQGAPSIGRPLHGTRAYVLDDSMSPVPVGVPGELYLGGAGLARGYLGRPELTAERFVPNPHGPQGQGGERLYRTGDLVRYRANGELEYLGRIDHQIKLRGFRIELGEVEQALRRHEQVRDVVVVVREDGPGDRRLVAYVVTGETVALEAAALREHLRRQLPDYMVPAAFVFLPALPLSPNGKVDRKALPAPQGVPAVAGQEFVSPRDRIELLLTHAWEQLLRVRPIGVKQNFFALGGHSLLAVGLMAQIERQFGRKLPLNTLFTHSTIEEQAALLRREEHTGQPWTPLVPIQPRGERPPLFLVHPIGGNILCYATLARHLGGEQPLYGLEAAGVDGAREPLDDLAAMAARYTEALRTIQAQGPYRLGGWSMGGVVAFEMAQQLVRQGEKVDLLILIDSWAPALLGGSAFPARDEAELFLEFAWDLGRVLGQAIALSREELDPLGPEARIRLLLDRARQLGVLPPNVDVEQVRALYRVFHAHRTALERYRLPSNEHGAGLGVDPGRVVLFRPMTNPSTSDAVAAAGPSSSALTDPWAQVTPQGLEFHPLPGDHYSMLAESHVAELASILRRLLGEPLPTTTERAELTSE